MEHWILSMMDTPVEHLGAALEEMHRITYNLLKFTQVRVIQFTKF